MGKNSNDFFISGIQQIGIGNPDMVKTRNYYAKYFGFKTQVFEEEAVADLMLPYTGGEPQSRIASLVLNMNGGGGLEIWQYTTRKLIPQKAPTLPGDLGINAMKVKSREVDATRQYFIEKKLPIINPVYSKTKGLPAFFMKDLHGNIVEVTKSQSWYREGNGVLGGVGGAIIGVSDIEKSKAFYGSLLGFNQKVWEAEGSFEDLDAWAGEKHQYKRTILERTDPYKGPFSNLLGAVQIELIQVLDREPTKLFEGRFWGDPGYIHLCFDVVGMDALKDKAESLNHPFTVDSANSFDMGEAAGRFAYVEDPDGTLIEFVETHKVPILKKLNLYMKLKNRNPEKPLPRWMTNALSLNKVKFEDKA